MIRMINVIKGHITNLNKLKKTKIWHLQLQILNKIKADDYHWENSSCGMSTQAWSGRKIIWFTAQNFDVIYTPTKAMVDMISLSITYYCFQYITLCIDFYIVFYTFIKYMQMKIIESVVKTYINITILFCSWFRTHENCENR